MQASEAQARVAEYHLTDHPLFSSALGRLIEALLHSSGDDDWCGRFPAYVDGALFELRKSGSDHFEGHGVCAIGPDQYAEPFSVELCFDPTSKEMTRATVLFGAANSTKPGVGSRAGKALARSVLARALSARHKTEFKWKHRFTLSEGEWSSSEAQGSK